MILPALRSACCIALVVAIPAAIAATPADRTRVEHHDVDQMLAQRSIPYTSDDVVSMDVTPDGAHVAFLLRTKTGVAVFLDGKKVFEGPSDICTKNPALFWTTPDGHVVFASDCTTLRMDDQILSQNNPVLTVAREIARYENGKLIYPDDRSIQSYDPIQKRTATLYRTEDPVIMLRTAGTHVAYATQNPQTRESALYLNGKKVSVVPVDNPWNFVLTRKGDLYYFAREGSRYAIYRNDRPYLRRAGQTGFVFADDSGNIWHIGFQPATERRPLRIWLQKNTQARNYLPRNVENAEGAMAFQNGQFAVRAQRWSEFTLLKNGQFEGTSFSFDSGYKDFNGITFAPNGKTYMRNFSQGHWFAYEDGMMMDYPFENIWFIRLDPQGTVHLYGSR